MVPTAKHNLASIADGECRTTGKNEWSIDYCSPRIEKFTVPVQKERTKHMMMIYCFTHQITIGNDRINCPNSVLQIPTTEDFTINNYTYKGHPFVLTLTAEEQKLNFELDLLTTKQINPFTIKLENENYDLKDHLKQHLKSSPFNLFTVIINCIVAAYLFK